MGDEHRQQSVERYEEAAISLLMEEYLEAEGARLLQKIDQLQENGELPEIPAELDEKCRKLIDKTFAAQERRTKLKNLRTFVSKAAVIVLSLCAISAVTVLSVDAFRIPVLNFLMDQSGRYSTVVFDEYETTGDTAKNSAITKLENNLPEGYQVLKHTISDASDRITCTDQNGRIIYLEICKIDGGFNVDTEDEEYHEVELGQYAAVFQEKEGYHLRWIDQNSNSLYTLFSNGLSDVEFWKLAYVIAE